MAIRMVQLGSPRSADEGLRIGTVRRPPRGMPKAEFASRDYYDVWYPELSPSAELMALAKPRKKMPTPKTGKLLTKPFAKKWPLHPLPARWICWPRCPTTARWRWVAIAPMRPTAIAVFCAACWPSAVPSSVPARHKH